MKLPFFRKQVNKNKPFFGLFLKEKEGTGLIMKSENSNLILLDQEKFAYSNGWEHLTEDIDEIILKLEQRTKVQVHETIFFIYSHFIDEKTKEIKKPFLAKIKELVKNLNLKALGYIECYEAVLHYLEKKEELPLTGVLVELDKANLSVFIYKRGELAYSKVLAHTDNLIDDLLTCFSEIKGKFLLPSRIILYDSKDMDNESTEIVTYRWSEELFVQLPRVEVVKEHELIQGLLGVFAEQFGKQATNIEFKETRPRSEILGFVIGGDVAEARKPALTTEVQPPVSNPVFISIKNLIRDMSEKLTRLPKLFSKRWTVALGLILIGVGLLLNEYFFHKAELTLFLPAQTIKKEFELSSADLRIKIDEKIVNLTDSKPTTGKKEIGEKARGSITVHNFDDKEKTFVKGTIFETGNLKFVLDQDVKLASASVVTINGGLVKQPGKAKSSVTAEVIGPQSNISSGKQFKTGDFPVSLYFAINENSFAGGTKKDVKTVAKKDLDDLKKTVQELAKKQKSDKIDQTPTQSGQEKIDKKILEQLTETSFTEEKFDKEVGEESDTIKLDAKIELKIYSYQEDELKKFLANNLADQLEKGFVLQKDKLTYKLEEAEKNDSEVLLKMAVNGQTIKDIPNNEVIKLVRGVNSEAVEKLLKNKFKVEGFNLEIEPKIIFLQNRMPFFGKNISLKISSL